MKAGKYLSVVLAALLLAGCAGADSSGSTDTSSESDASQAQQAEESKASEDSSKTDEPAQNTDDKSGGRPTYDLKENDAEVAFSSEGGIYKDEFELTLSGDGKIYYTLDGSDPRTSDTRQLYSAPIDIKSRKGDKNVVSAVEPGLISGNFNKGNSRKKTLTCELSAPSDDAVDKCTVIRACAENSDGTVTKAFTNTYYIGTAADHIPGIEESCKAIDGTLAVVSINMNYDDLFDSTYGIYVKGDIFDKALQQYIDSGERIEDETGRKLDANYKQKGKEWERPCHIELFETDKDGATRAITQDCGIRIQGNYSRSDLIKGFRLFARNDYGDNKFRYEVFSGLKDTNGETIDDFKSLVLRAGGNCAFTAKFNDTFWQKASESLDCSTKASRPCVVYLNGEYWGLYLLEEDYSDNYFEDHYGVDHTDVVVYKGDAEALKLGYKLDEGELPEGENEKYYFSDLLAFFRTHSNIADDAAYEEFSKIVDIESVRDYFLSEVWINNKWDWPGKNWSMWRTVNVDESNPYADARWRFMLYDMEFGGVSGASDCGTNTVKEDNYKPKGLLDFDTNNPAVLCFAYLMTNESFRTDYCERLEKLSEGIYSQENLTTLLEKLTAQYSPLYDQFFLRYPGTGSTDEALNGGYSSVKCVQDFINGRENNIERITSWIEKQF